MTTSEKSESHPGRASVRGKLRLSREGLKSALVCSVNSGLGLRRCAARGEFSDRTLDVHTAAELIKGAVSPGAETWADLGAGTGTFTLALASLLGEHGRVIALDRDAAALAELRSTVRASALEKRVVVRRGDFLQPLELPPLDGVLLANALHFVPRHDQRSVLSHILTLIRPLGRLLIVDYDGRAANQWVPFPVSSRRLSEMLMELGVAEPTIVGSIPSRYGGNIYAVAGSMSAERR